MKILNKLLLTTGIIGSLGIFGCEPSNTEEVNERDNPYSLKIETSQNNMEIKEDSINTQNSDSDDFLEKYAISLSENGQLYVFLALSDNDHNDNKYDHVMVRTLFKKFNFIQERSYDFSKNGKSLEYHERLMKYDPKQKSAILNGEFGDFHIELKQYNLNELPSQIKWRIEEILSSAPNNLEGYLKREYENSKYSEKE